MTWFHSHERLADAKCRICGWFDADTQFGVCVACQEILLLGGEREGWILAGLEEEMLETPEAWLPYGWRITTVGTTTMLIYPDSRWP